MKTIIIKILGAVSILPALAFSGCAAPDLSQSPPTPPPSGDEKRYLNICLDGKVGWQNEANAVIPVPDLKVTLISADGVRTDSARTNTNGRFLIEHADVPVGYYWEKHIYVEVSDDRAPDQQDGKARYETVRILKQIETAPDNTALLTMDEILVKRIQNPAASTNSTKWNLK